LPASSKSCPALGLVGVAAPKSVIARKRTFAEANEDNIDEAVILNRERVGDPVNRDQQQEHQQIFGVDEYENDKAKLYDEHYVGNAEHHGRPCQASHKRIEARFCLLLHLAATHATRQRLDDLRSAENQGNADYN